MQLRPLLKTVVPAPMKRSRLVRLVDHVVRLVDHVVRNHDAVYDKAYYNSAVEARRPARRR